MRRLLASGALILVGFALNQLAARLDYSWGAAAAGLAALVGYGLAVTAGPLRRLWQWAGSADWRRLLGTVLMFGVLSGVLGSVTAWILILQARTARTAADHPASLPGSPEKDRLAVLLSEQARIAAVAIQPRFEFSHKDCSNVAGMGERLLDCLEIWNNGQPVTDYSIMQYSFLQIFRQDRGEERYLPSYYYLERLRTSNLVGLLVTFVSRADPSLFGPARERSGPANTKLEIQRIEAELREQCGAGSWVRLRVYLAIYYTDLSGTYRDESFEMWPDSNWWGPNRSWAPLGFKASEFEPYLHSAAIRSADYPWNISASSLVEAWEKLVTPAVFQRIGVVSGKK